MAPGPAPGRPPPPLPLAASRRQAAAACVANRDSRQGGRAWASRQLQGRLACHARRWACASQQHPAVVAAHGGPRDAWRRPRAHTARRHAAVHDRRVQGALPAPGLRRAAVLHVQGHRRAGGRAQRAAGGAHGCVGGCWAGWVLSAGLALRLAPVLPASAFEPCSRFPTLRRIWKDAVAAVLGPGLAGTLRGRGAAAPSGSTCQLARHLPRLLTGSPDASPVSLPAPSSTPPQVREKQRIEEGLAAEKAAAEAARAAGADGIADPDAADGCGAGACCGEVRGCAAVVSAWGSQCHSSAPHPPGWGLLAHHSLCCPLVPRTGRPAGAGRRRVPGARGRRRGGRPAAAAAQAAQDLLRHAHPQPDRAGGCWVVGGGGWAPAAGCCCQRLCGGCRGAAVEQCAAFRALPPCSGMLGGRPAPTSGTPPLPLLHPPSPQVVKELKRSQFNPRMAVLVGAGLCCLGLWCWAES